MKIKRKPILMVRRVGKHIEYYIQQGNQKINFFLDRETHGELLRQAKQACDVGSQKSELPPDAILLRVAEV